MFTIYIAKATEDFGLPVMHRIYEQFCQTVKQHKCAFDSLPSNASWVKLIVCIVDSVGTLNHATNPSYPDTEPRPRMSRIKTRTGPSVSGSTVAKTRFSNQNKQMNPLF